MKFAILLLASITLFGQRVDQAPRQPATFALASLPSATTWVGSVVIATGVTAGSCTSAGIGRTLCIAAGGIWVPLGGAVAGVTSVTAGASGALIITPTTGAVVVDVDPAYIPGLTLTNAFTGANTFGAIGTATNCASSGGTCSTASAGASSIAAAATTVTVATTRVTANSQIILTFDSSLGARLGITCNTTFQQPYVVTRTAATSFVVNVASGPVTNGLCFNWAIFN